MFFHVYFETTFFKECQTESLAVTLAFVQCQTSSLAFQLLTIRLIQQGFFNELV